ncbi:MAG: AzlC family ABC transporter permease [Spirochaetales bacterium]
MNKTLVLQAVKITSPVFFGYIAIGIPFGLMLVNAGYPWWMALLMSCVMYAGAGQYAAVGLFIAGADISTVIFTTLAINIRHIVYGLSLIDKLSDIGRWKYYVSFALTDETYVLLTGCPLPPNVSGGSYFALISALNQSYWILGSVIGAVLGLLIPFSFEGIDFALTALFIVLLIDRLRVTKNPLPAIIGFVCALAVLFLFGDTNMLIITIAIGIVVLMVFRKPLACYEEKKNHD